MKRKIRYGMIGGGRGAFIGGVHRMAAALDGQMELVCGAFSSDPQRSKASGSDLFLPGDRCYASFQEMLEKEASLPETDRIDVVVIVTPNDLHFAPAMMALDRGFHVICDKPLCLTLEEAEQIKAKVNSTGLLFALTHTYAGYPMVKHARQMIAKGDLGNVRRVVVEYPQGWLSTALEHEHQKQASWRTDPTRAGAAGAIGDIGTHAAHLAEYMSGLEIDSVCADLHTHIRGRQLDDDGSVLLRMKNDVRGVLYASQISAGEENNLRIRVYGEKGSVDWSQMEPNSLVVRWLDRPMEVLRTGSAYLSQVAQKHARIPAGHPEGYLEAFANIYKNVAHHIQARLVNEKADPELDFPSVEDGVRGMKFIAAVVTSGTNDNVKWVSV